MPLIGDLECRRTRVIKPDASRHADTMTGQLYNKGVKNERFVGVFSYGVMGGWIV